MVKLVDVELEELIVWINNIHTFNFSGYSRASLKRRVERFLQCNSLSLFDLKSLLVNDDNFFGTFLAEITVNITEMFRDPLFFKLLRECVIPQLTSYRVVRAWSAGCSTGEEVYALSILLNEENVSERTVIYGTDVNSNVLGKAKSGIYDLIQMKQYTQNYLAAGGKNSLSDFYHAKYDAAIMDSKLKRNVFFLRHNLVSDGAFSEFQLICCRNVLIYFTQEQQKKVLKLLYDSLSPLGFLCLGAREALTGENVLRNLRVIDKKANIYQKVN